MHFNQNLAGMKPESELELGIYLLRIFLSVLLECWEGREQLQDQCALEERTVMPCDPLVNIYSFVDVQQGEKKWGRTWKKPSLEVLCCCTAELPASPGVQSTWSTQDISSLLQYPTSKHSHSGHEPNSVK